MTTHPEPIEEQIAPKDLPTDYEKYPVPWSTYSYGNGRYTVSDGEERVFANVYCWDDADGFALTQAVERTEILDARTKAEALGRNQPKFADSSSDKQYLVTLTTWADAWTRVWRLEARALLREMYEKATPRSAERKALEVALSAIARLLREDRR